MRVFAPARLRPPRPRLSSASRPISTAATTTTKREGDISDAFASMSGAGAAPLPDRFRRLKQELVAGHEAAVTAGWHRLLRRLRAENEQLAALGPRAIPAVRFGRLAEDLQANAAAIRTRGVVVVRGVVPEAEARAYKDEIEAYVAANPSTRGFPADDRQVFELYWSAPQLRARAHPRLLATQRALLRLWHADTAAGGGSAAVHLGQPVAYADRLRIRQPGDARFALGPHMDGGSVERWERAGYGTSGVYAAVFRGAWEQYDAWDAARRAGAVTNRYDGLGACSAFRAFQGWLSMSRTGPGEGSLRVYPLVQLAAAYTLLRPFFRLRGGGDDVLDPGRWALDVATPDLQGATPGMGQEFPDGAHPHLELARAMVSVPAVAPGDYVAWHCDVVHAVDRAHRGPGDASVLYIPVCPLTAANARYLARQRAAFQAGTPAPDFPGGAGESAHVGRPAAADTIRTDDGRRAMGLAPFATDGLTGAARAVTEEANAVLGW